MNWVRRLFFPKAQEAPAYPVIDDDWAFRHEDDAHYEFNERFYKDARERQREYEDTLEFEAKMKAAMERFRIFRSRERDDGAVDRYTDLDDPDLRVTWLRNPLSPANHYGVHFKDTDEYGVCESFHFGDGKFSTTYRRVVDERFGADGYP